MHLLRGTSAAAAALAAVCAGALGQEPAAVALGTYLKGPTFTVEWSDPAQWDPAAEVEAECAQVSPGAPPGSTDWYWFRPAGERVDVFRVSSRGARGIQASPSVQVSRGGMEAGEYRAFLALLARIESARLVPVSGSRSSWTKSDAEFGVAIRVEDRAGVRLEGRWVGNPSSSDEIRYAKAKAAAGLVKDSVSALNLQLAEPTPELRAWVAIKSLRDYSSLAQTSLGWTDHDRKLLAGYRQILAALGDPAAWLRVEGRTAVRVRVVDEAGSPVEGARVELSGVHTRVEAVPRVGEEGVYVAFIPRFPHTLVVDAGGRARVTVEVDVGERSPQELVVRLGPKATSN